jgi:hypothetical protein
MMNNRIVLWGSNKDDQRVLLALELRVSDNAVDLFVIPDKEVSNDLDVAMHQRWRNGEVVEIPETAEKRSLTLSLSDTLLPDDLKAERTDVLNRAQTEWHFVVLSSKLLDSYKNELANLASTVGSLTHYSQETWNNLKDYWEKVLGQVRERNLSRDQADQIKDEVNQLFTQLKQQRTELEDVARKGSLEVFNQLSAVLDDIENRIRSNGRFKSIFEDLKALQSSFRDSKMVRDHSNDLWNRLDAAFKLAKDQKFGGNGEETPNNRTERRVDMVEDQIVKMKDSIDRDKKELEFQKKRVDSSDGQLEAQIRLAKIQMIQMRVDSKEVKLQEFLTSREDLEKRIEQNKERDLKKAEKEKAEARIAAEIEDRDKLLKEKKEAKTNQVAEPVTVVVETAPEVVVETAPEVVVETAPEVVVETAPEVVVDAAPVPTVTKVTKSVAKPVEEVALDAPVVTTTVSEDENLELELDAPVMITETTSVIVDDAQIEVEQTVALLEDNKEVSVAHNAAEITADIVDSIG